MKLIVGLGNIGLKYKQTRHNVGFMFMDKLASEYKVTFKLEKNFKGLLCKTKINDEDIIFLKPATYMNLSGESVYLVKEYFKINDEVHIQFYPEGRGRAFLSGGGHFNKNYLSDCVI